MSELTVRFRRSVWGAARLLLSANIIIAEGAAAPNQAVPIKGGWRPLSSGAKPGVEPITVRKGAVVLEQPVVPFKSARLEEDLIFKSMKIPAGAELFGVVALTTGKSFYCSDRMYPNGNILGRQFYCFNDQDEDGRLDGRWGTFQSGYPITNALPSVSVVWNREQIDPIRFSAFDYDAVTARFAVGIILKGINSKKRRAIFTPAYGIRQKITQTDQSFTADLSTLPVSIDILGARLEILAFTDNNVTLKILEPLPDEPLSMNAEFRVR